jgi:hypothetical protein
MNFGTVGRKMVRVAPKLSPYGMTWLVGAIHLALEFR